MEINQNLNKPVDETKVDVTIEESNQEQRPAQPEPIAEQPAEPSQPACVCTEPKKKCCCHCGTIAMIVMALAIVALYVLHFCGIGAPKGKVNPNATAPIVAEGNLKVAYINTDTLIAKYQYAIDMQKELEEYQASKEQSYKQQMTQFQNDYQNYLQTGDKLTLTQQKQKEEELKARAEKLQNLEGELTMQVQQKLLKDSEKMTNAVYAFIREYNAANQQFDIILSKSFNSSPVLYGNPGMDITNEILEGLNKEYADLKK